MDATIAEKLFISRACEKDLPEIQAIYSHYVENSSVTLEETIPSIEEIYARWKNSTEKSLPYIIAKYDGKIVGYAYAFPYRHRSAYRFTVEESVYIAKDYHGKGLGKLLLGEIITSCKTLGYKQMVAVIAGADNAPSIVLHTKLGFVQAGVLKNVGFKFEKWIDTIIMQKEL